MKAVVFNLGCKVNTYDGEMIAGGLKSAGFSVSYDFEYADIYILNTCAVTGEAERKSRQAVARAKKVNPNARIIVCGCAAEKDGIQFAKKENVYYVSGVANKSKITEIAVEMLNTDNKAADHSQSFENVNVSELPSVFEDEGIFDTPRTRAYIKVQDGCNNFCSYCIVPYLRGRSRSRSLESILAEADKLAGSADFGVNANVEKANVENAGVEKASVQGKNLAKSGSEYADKDEGIKEVVLIGINLSAYGRDIGSSLTDLVAAFAKYPFRLRLGSLEANVITAEFLAAAKANPNFCPHFHLSLQSGNLETLQAMNRKYTPQEYLEKVEMIRSVFPDAAITTDIIAGYPTETDTQFEDSCRFLKKVGFADIHAFPFSPREGTKAGNLKPLSKDVVESRAKTLSKLKQAEKDAFLAKFVDKKLLVLFEKKEGGLFVGYSKNYLKVYAQKAEENQVLTVTPKEIFKDGLK